MRSRALLIAWVVLLLVLGGVALWAELTYSGKPGGHAAPGEQADGKVIDVDPNAVGAESGTALVGQPKQGSGPPGRVEDVVVLPARPLSDLPETAAVAPQGQGNRPPPPRIAFATTQPADDGRPRIAIVMNHIGIGNARSRQAIERLPEAITLAVMVYAEGAAGWLRDGRANGHEVLLAIPMEPIDYPRYDPGPKPLLIDLDDLENLSRLDKALSGLTGFVGLLSHMGSRFLSDPDRLRPILAATADRGLIFLDSRSGPDSAVAELAPTVGLHVALNDRFIDDIPSRDDIDRRLKELEAIATRRGFAVGVATHYPVTIERLRQWAGTLDKRGFVLTPITSVARKMTP